jgi:hypothetical protein
MQTPTNVLVAIAQVHAALEHLYRVLEAERDSAQADYASLLELPGATKDPHIAALLELADERGYHARRALRIGFDGTEAFAAPTPEDLGYSAVVSE